VKAEHDLVAAAVEVGAPVVHDRTAAAKYLAEQYPDSLLAEIVRVGHDYDFTPRPPLMPTTARPGSAEKFTVLAARLLAGEDLWHPDDERPRD
jgi:hypothetical protein